MLLDDGNIIVIAQGNSKAKKKILLSPVSRPTLEKGADPKNFVKKFFFFTFFIQKSFFKQLFHGNKRIKKNF